MKLIGNLSRSQGLTGSLNRSANGGASVSPFNGTPQMDGSAAAGSSLAYARGDHVHPTDTSRLAANQGAANAGKVMVVDNDGAVVPAAAPSGGGLSEAVKQALLQLAEKVAYIDEDGQDYYDALHDALYPPADLVSISAVYTQSGTVYTTDTLDSLKSDLVVTATYSDSSTSTVTTYTLSGTLTAGTSTITVSYGGKTATFTVTVTAAVDPAEAWEDGVPYEITLTTGEYVSNTGIKSTTTDWGRTNYLPCKGAASITITGSVGSGAYSGWFDSNKTYIRNLNPTAANLSNIPSNACYLVVSQTNTNLANIQSITPHSA